MALTAGYSPARRGAPPTSGNFGGSVAASETIWRGGMLCWNAAGTLQRLQTAGSVAFAGMASKDYNNSASATAASVGMEALLGTYALTVAVSDGCAITRANITVYAVCGATPAANVQCALPNASTGVGGATAFVNLWSGRTIWLAPLPVSTQARSTSGRIFARFFANVTLNGSATSPGSLGITPRLTWTLLSHAPVAAPAAGPVAGSPLNISWVSLA